MIRPADGKSYTIDDMRGDLNHLYELLSVMVDLQQSMDHRIAEVRTMSALGWIACDMANSLKERCEEGFDKKGGAK